jgi:mono/diheme cytochrome c family protein
VKKRFLGWFLVWALASPAWGATLKIRLNASHPDRALGDWEGKDLAEIKQATSSEKDPGGPLIRKFHGPLVSALIEKAMEKVPGELKAQVDLVIFRNGGGESVIVPRSLITKYPLLLSQEPEAEGGLTLISPWTSKPKILQEGLPVERYTLKGVSQVELANSRETFGGLYLKKRVDPVAMRGEKVFIQNCTACHATGPSSLKTGDVEQGHPGGKGIARLVDRARHALKTYWDSYRGENISGAN